MRPLRGAVAVVTGAASGIGRALCIRLAQEGAALALADRDARGLEETAKELSAAPQVTTHTLDVSNEAEVERFASHVAARHGRASLLVNNAGVALHGDFEQISQADFEWLMGTNFWGTVYGVWHRRLRNGFQFRARDVSRECRPDLPRP